MPYMREPAYFDSDLALYKNFNITERQKLQFRISATNWLNHPLPQFGLAGIGDNSSTLRTTTPSREQSSGVQPAFAYGRALQTADALPGACGGLVANQHEFHDNRQAGVQDWQPVAAVRREVLLLGGHYVTALSHWFQGAHA